VFLFSRKYRQLLGLDITTSSIKLIELSMAGGQYRVEAYAAEPTPPNSMNEKSIVDPQSIGDAIGRAVKRSGAKSREVAIAISGDAAITKVIQLPHGLRDSDMEAQVEMQADQYIPFPMDEVSYDFEVLGRSDKDSESDDVLLVASRTENVEQRRAAVAAAGLSARIVDVEAFALENACKLMTHQMPDGGIDHAIAVVDFGASSTTFSVLKNLRVAYTRDFAFGGQQLTEEIMRTYGLTMEEAGRAKKEGGPEKIVLRRAKTSEIKLGRTHGAGKTVSIQVRKKRTYVKRAATEDEAQVEENKPAPVEELTAAAATTVETPQTTAPMQADAASKPATQPIEPAGDVMVEELPPVSDTAVPAIEEDAEAKAKRKEKHRLDEEESASDRHKKKKKVKPTKEKRKKEKERKNKKKKKRKKKKSF